MQHDDNRMLHRRLIQQVTGVKQVSYAAKPQKM
ncbi:hypothetical protein BN439_0367 [Erwinia amylovora Ea644]|nr:hypothetical protein BN439_0367 [Erwinia amylovora Ea644]CCP05453.1 hypothetical protein BN440_0400 [Erwinia amylovora MR1]